MNVRSMTRLLSAGVLFATSLMTTVAVGAQEVDAPEADGQTCVSQDINAHMWIGQPERSDIFAIDIPAGTVSIPTATSRDFYPGRSQVVQASEKWQLEFVNDAGETIAVSAVTGDVPDGADDQSWTGSLGTVDLPDGAAGIRALHRPDLPDAGPIPTSGQSVWATGVTLCWPTANLAPCGTDADGNVIPVLEDGTCEVVGEGPVVPPVCTDADGNTVAAGTDGTCPTPPPAGPTLPVTGVESLLLIALSGVFVMAAGWSLVLRPGAVLKD